LSTPRVVLAGDHTTWPRLHARTLPDRSYQHQPTPIRGVRPITIGFGSSTLAFVPQQAGSWALPLLHERVSTKEDALSKAASQLQRGCRMLPASVKVVRPLAMYDSQYGCAPFVKATSEIECDKIVRLRPNLSLRKPPPPYRGRGPYPKHGPAFKLKDPQSWGPSGEYLQLEDDNLGRVEVQLWEKLHFTASSEQTAHDGNTYHSSRC
jgi:DDE superfamily endonuclease